MPGIEIKRLRKEGKLDEALKMAKEEFEAVPTDDWAKRNLAWVYDSYCKKYAEEGNYQAFDDSVCALIELGLNESDTMLINSIGWKFRSMLSSLENITDENERTRVLDRMFELVRQFNFEKPSETYSVIFKAFLKHKNVWPRFNEFCDWWCFDNFRKEDYECETLSNGRRMSVSLVESAYIAYAKGLIHKLDKDAINAFIPKLQELAEQNPKMLYPNYYIGKLMLAKGNDKQEVFSTLLPFVRKKQSDFWVWQLLAEALEDDNEKCMACLLRAVHCNTSEQYLVRLYFILAKAFKQLHYYADARFYIDKYIRVKKDTQTKVSTEACNMTNESWYAEAAEQEPMYELDYMLITNELLYGDIPETDSVVSFVNKDKKMVTVVYGKEQEGFFKYDSSLCPQIGMNLSIRIQEISKDGYMKVFSSRVCPESFDDGLEYYKEVEGTVIYNKSKGIYSLKSGDIICFIPHQDVERLSIVKDQIIKASILYTYNKKKERWMWRIVKLDVV